MRTARLALAIFTVFSGACGSLPPRVTPKRPPAELRPEPEARAVSVLLDSAESCPQLTTDGSGRLYFAALPDPAVGRKLPSLIVGQGYGASSEWSRHLRGEFVSFASSRGQLGEGIAVGGVSMAPLEGALLRPMRPTEGASGLFVVSFAADGRRRFGLWFAVHIRTPLDAPRITAITLGPRSEVTIAGVTQEAVDLGTGTIAPEEAAYDHTLAFVARYAPDGTPVRVAARKARSGTLPRLAAWSDGGVVVAFDGQDGAPVLEAFDGDAFGMSEGRRIPAAISGRVDALAAAGPGEMVVATESTTEAEPRLAQLARVTRQGELVWSRTMRGQIALGALTVRANGEPWFAGWFEGPSGGCEPPSPMAEPAYHDDLPRLQIVSADGTRCRSVPVATRSAIWKPPASFVELPADHMLYATPCLGDLALPGLAPRSLGAFLTRCFVFDLPADSKEYTP